MTVKSKLAKITGTLIMLSGMAGVLGALIAVSILTVFTEQGLLAGLLILLPIPIVFLGFNVWRGSKATAIIALIVHLLAVFSFESQEFAWSLTVGFTLYIKLQIGEVIIGVDFIPLVMSVLLLMLVLQKDKIPQQGGSLNSEKPGASLH